MQAPQAAGARRDPPAAARPARMHASRPGCAADRPPSPPPSVPRRASLARAARCPRPATPGTTYGQHMPRLYQRSSEVIRGHQRSSEVIRGHQRSSEVIRGHQRSSEVIRGHHTWGSLCNGSSYPRRQRSRALPGRSSVSAPTSSAGMPLEAEGSTRPIQRPRAVAAPDTAPEPPWLPPPVPPPPALLPPC